MAPHQTNIVYLLLGHLNRHLWFEIPGLGIFNGSKTATYINHIEQTIYPGRIDVEFVAANTLRTEIMIQNMVSETGFTQELLEEHLAALCQTISESFKHNSSYEFLPFGKINIENGVLIFNQSPTNIHQEFYWMEPLSLIPISVPYDNVAAPFLPVPIQQTKSKKEFRYLLLALAILWLIFLGLLFCPPASKNHVKDNMPLLIDSVAIKASVDSIKVPQVSIQVQDSVVRANKDSIKVNSDTLHLLKNEAVIDSMNINKLNEQIKNKPCIIIVGSFIKISNAKRLANKVKDNGYEVYRGEYGKFHRVGIQFNCFEHDLKEMLNELKKKFQPDAWVLKF